MNVPKLKLVRFGKSKFRSTPASKNSPTWTYWEAVPLAVDVNGQGTAGGCPLTPSRGTVFTIAVPMLEASVVPVAKNPLFQV